MEPTQQMPYRLSGLSVFIAVTVRPSHPCRPPFPFSAAPSPSLTGGQAHGQAVAVS